MLYASKRRISLWSRNFAIDAIALAFSATSAFAADLPPIKAPSVAPLPPPPLWTGFYAGVNAGYSWGNVAAVDPGSTQYDFNFGPFPSRLGEFLIPGLSAPAALGEARFQSNGFLGGGQAGYNFQFNPWLALGVEADMQGSRVSGQGSFVGASTCCAFNSVFITVDNAWAATSITRQVDWLGTVRGRFGYLVTPTLLAYATGGLAYAGVTASTTHIQTFTTTVTTRNSPGNPVIRPLASFMGAGGYSDTRVGWTVGGGLEWMFWPNWSAKVEYLYYDLGAMQYATNFVWYAAMDFAGIPDGPINTPVTRMKFNGNIVRAGVNYHFNWASVPAVGKLLRIPARPLC